MRTKETPPPIPVQAAEPPAATSPSPRKRSASPASPEAIGPHARAFAAESRPSTKATTEATGKGLALAQLRAGAVDNRPFGPFYTRGNAVAEWVDRHVGNRDGVLDSSDLQAYVARYGQDPTHHANIRQLALHLGVITIQVGRQITLATAGHTQVHVQSHGRRDEVRSEPSPVARSTAKSERDRLLDTLVDVDGMPWMGVGFPIA